MLRAFLDRWFDWVAGRSRRRERHEAVWSSQELEYRRMLAANAGNEILIAAAGTTGAEQMSLWIDGQKVKTWQNVGGNVATRQFQSFTYTAAANFDPNKVRVSFDNDLFVAGQTDRNLVVDFIRTGGVQFDPESPTTFSTGTWRSGVGVQPGYTQSEWLHTNGYFEFSNAAAQYGSTIIIQAAGDENTETMELWVKGSFAKRWLNVAGDADTRAFETYHYRAAQTVAAADIDIRFTNDAFGPNLDRNLRVDRIIVDGRTTQTEAPNTYSTGTWSPADGIVPGYRRSEWLHANGQLSYENRPLTPGAIGLATSLVSVNESAGNATVGLVRTGGSDGRITVDYQTFGGTATSGADFTARVGTVVFEDGQTSKTVSIPIFDDLILDEFDEQFTFTIDNVTGGGTLRAPRTATVTIIDNDGTSIPLPNYTNFASTTGLKLNGNASRSSNALQLTSAAENQRGSAFFATPIGLGYGKSFRTNFSFRLDGGDGASGADGIAFVLHRNAANASALGASGDGMGYEGISDSIAFEFDTYEGGSDINGNHLAISLNGQTFNTWVSGSTGGFDLNSGDVYHAWIEYNGDSSKVAVYLSNTNVKPSGALIDSELDIPFFAGDYLGTGVKTYAGFTGATGAVTNRQQILSWKLDTGTPPADPPILQEGNVRNVTVASGFNLPTAVDWINAGSNSVMLVAEKGGVVKSVVGGVVQALPFIDISAITNEAGDRGLIDIATHPNFASNPYVYLLYTYDPPETQNFTSDPNARPDGPGNRAGRLVRVTADPLTGYKRAIAGSEVVLLGTNSTWADFNGFVNSTIDIDEPPAGVSPTGVNLRDFINSDSESHSVGGLAFGLDGSLFVTTGDGASYNRVDPRAIRVQDINNLSGKVLRIDPLTGRGLADNPFATSDLDANRSKVYQYGLRNPFRVTVNPTNGKLYIGDVGWSDWEEVNQASAGANFGWPYYQGGNNTSVVNEQYATLPEAQAYYASGQTPAAPRFGLSHNIDGINSIVMGDFISTNTYGQSLNGMVLFNDLGQGIVRGATFNSSGSLTGVTTFATGANVVVQIEQGSDGLLYYVDLDDGLVGRWEPI